jgi:hypothetical protein
MALLPVGEGEGVAERLAVTVKVSMGKGVDVEDAVTRATVRVGVALGEPVWLSEVVVLALEKVVRVTLTQEEAEGQRETEGEALVEGGVVREAARLRVAVPVPVLHLLTAAL